MVGKVFPPRRLRHQVLLAFVVFIALGSATLLWRGHIEDKRASQQVTVYVAVRDLRPFQKVRPQDLQRVMLARADVPVDAVSSRDEVEGKYLFSNLMKDEPIMRNQIGPAAPAGLGDHPILTVAGGQALTLGGKLQPGDSVDLLLGGAAESSVPVVKGCLVLAVEQHAEGSLLTLLLPSDLTDEQATAVAGGHVAVVRRT